MTRDRLTIGTRVRLRGRSETGTVVANQYAFRGVERCSVLWDHDSSRTWMAVSTETLERITPPLGSRVLVPWQGEMVAGTLLDIVGDNAAIDVGNGATQVSRVAEVQPFTVPAEARPVSVGVLYHPASCGGGR